MGLAIVSAKTEFARSYGEDLMPDSDSIYHDHFMPSDRRELIQTGERLAGLKEDFAELKRTIEAGGRHHADVVRQMEVDLKTDSRRIELELRAAIKDLDLRARVLENFRYWILGGAAIAGAAAGLLARFFHS
jgi:hypothetical protein